MVRGRSVSRKITARSTNTGCGTSKALQSHSKYPNDCGQRSQNGNDAQMETHSQMTERKPKKRARGLPTECRGTQPPPSTMSECNFMRHIQRPKSGRVQRSPATNNIKRNAEDRGDRQRDNHSLNEHHRKPENRIRWSDVEIMCDKLVRNVDERRDESSHEHSQPKSPDKPMRHDSNHDCYCAEQEEVVECHAPNRY